MLSLRKAARDRDVDGDDDAGSEVEEGQSGFGAVGTECGGLS